MMGLMCMPCGTYHTYQSDRNVSVSFRYRTFPVGVINADNMGLGTEEWPEGRWWLARSIVNPPKFRSLGIGSKMMELLLKALVQQKDFKELLVAPGGSYGSDEKRQINFYVKNGFKPFEKGALLWKK